MLSSKQSAEPCEARHPATTGPATRHRGQAPTTTGRRGARPSQVPIIPADNPAERRADALANLVAPPPVALGEAASSLLVSAPSAVWDAVESPGRLPRLAAGEVAESFPVDPSRVRVHAGGRAGESARMLDAAAYTIGDDIVLGKGYDSSSATGRRLIAHELARVADNQSQQPSGMSGDPYSPPVLAVARQGNPRHERGFAGEQSMGFTQYRYEDGWACIRGPSGSGGHRTNAGGEDGLFYSVRTGQLRIADNKAFTTKSTVSEATAIDPEVNLLQKLDDMIAAVEGMGSSADVPIRQDVLRLLRQTRAAVRLGEPIPGRVMLRVHNELGISTKVSARQERLGVRFIQGQDPVVPPEGTARPSVGLRTAPEVTPAPGISPGTSPSETSFKGVLGEPDVAGAAPGVAEEGAAAAGEAALEAAITEAGPTVAAIARVGAFARVAAAFAIETAIVVLLSLGLAYLEEREAHKLIRTRMREAEPDIRTALQDDADRVAELQRSPDRRGREREARSKRNRYSAG